MKKSTIALFPAREVAIVVALAGLVRIAYRLLAADSLFLQTPVVDASFFDIWARTMADGRVFQAQVFFKPPFEAYLLSWLYKMGMGMTGVQTLQMLAGVGTAVVTLGVGRLAFGARVGYLGALVTAWLPLLPFFENQLLAEPWTGLLSMGALLMLLMAAEGRGSTARNAVIGGVLLGLAALGRPNLMLPAIVLAAWFWWRGRRSGIPGVGTAVALLVGFAIGIAPATLHNMKYGDFVPISANLGPNLVAGHSDRADGVSAIPVGVQWDDLQLQTRQAGARSPAEASRFLTKQALGWMADNPGRTLQLLGRKILLLVSAMEGRNNINPRWMAEKEGVFLLSRWWPGTWLVIPFAMVGLVWAGRDRTGRGLLLWFVVAFAVTVLPFFVNARFRLPLWPLLALFAVAGVLWLFEGWRAGRRGALIVPLAVVVVLFVVGGVDWFGLGDDIWLARDHFNHGFALNREYDGRAASPVDAEKDFRRALALDPDDPDANEHFGAFLLQRAQRLLNEGSTRERRGNLEDAGKAFDQAEMLLAEAQERHTRAAELYPRSVKSWLNRGICRMWRGDLRAFRVRRALHGKDAERARTEGLAALQFYRDSVGDFQECLTVDPGQRDPRRNIQITIQAIRELPEVDPAITEFKTRLPAADGGSGQR
jgi:hypothetical protein